jgi:hypothetical protein
MLLLILWTSHIMKHNVGDINFDETKDDPSFVICNKEAVFQYYSVNTNYNGGRKVIREEVFLFLEKQELLFRNQSGYITFRFIVNCNGESGWFRVKTIDNNLNQVDFEAKTTKILEQSIRSLKKWNVRNYEGVTFDSYCQINFKIEKGEIIDIF